MIDSQLPIDPTAMTVGISGALAALTAVGLAVVARRRGRDRQPGATVRTLLVGLAVTAAIGVAVVGGVRSFEAVSTRFGSPLVPLTADGMIVACTALRIAALTRGWRIPGALATTYLFIGGTVWLNVAAAQDWSDAIADALAPISYAILVEMLAHLLRLHLHLATPPRQRVAALAWATSPVITTRVWLHLARTGTDDPAAARALVQQLIRLSSRLRMTCHGGRASPFGQHSRARTAALQVVRDGLLTAHQLAELLPADGQRVAPSVLLARVDRAALRCTHPAASGASASGAPEAPGTDTPGAPPAEAPDAGPPPAADAAASEASDALAAGGGNARALTRRVNGSAGLGPGRRSSVGPTDGRSDADLLAELHAVGGPMAVRKVQRLLGVGWPRAKRLTEQAGWTNPTPDAGPADGQPVNGNHAGDPEQGDPAQGDPAQGETEHSEPIEARTTQ